MPAIVNPPIIINESGGREQRWELPVDQETLERLIRTVFTNYWQEMWFGIIMEGAAWETAAPNAPKKISMYDGYLTLDFGRWHFHLCIGEHTESGPELGRIRRTSRAHLYRMIGRDGSPTSWGFRLFNGRDEQQMTVMLPNPFLTPTQEIEPRPVWERLQAWDQIRSDFLRLDPDAKDRTGRGFGRG